MNFPQERVKYSECKCCSGDTSGHTTARGIIRQLENILGKNCGSQQTHGVDPHNKNFKSSTQRNRQIFRFEKHSNKVANKMMI